MPSLAFAFLVCPLFSVPTLLTWLVYACFLMKLQRTTRSFYGIEGTTLADCGDGCCLPGHTLVRDEQEIALREYQRYNPTGYQSTPPMTTGPSQSRDQTEKTPSTP